MRGALAAGKNAESILLTVRNRLDAAVASMATLVAGDHSAGNRACTAAAYWRASPRMGANVVDRLRPEAPGYDEWWSWWWSMVDATLHTGATGPVLMSGSRFWAWDSYFRILGRASAPHIAGLLGQFRDPAIHVVARVSPSSIAAIAHSSIARRNARDQEQLQINAINALAPCHPAWFRVANTCRLSLWGGMRRGSVQVAPRPSLGHAPS